MATPLPVVVGVDVGGTSTDAVVVSKAQGQGHQILSESKHETTSDNTTGIRNAVLTVLRQAKQQQGEIVVTQVNIGTPHFVNAVVQNKHLSRVSVIRLCGPASRAVPPFADFPPSLKEVILGSVHFVNGGYRVDGREIEKVDQDEIKRVVEKIKGKGVKRIVVCGIFSPTKQEQEKEVGHLISELYPEASVTLSHTIGHVGLLERENAAILNESLKDLCQRTVSDFRHALQEIGTCCPIFLTQNDGTVISAEQAMATPVFTFASGLTNSMRGAAFLSQLSDAVVVDIGGTTTDVGMLRNRFPRETRRENFGGVKTNFSMPDLHSMGMGDGSYVVKTNGGRTTVGPLGAGCNLIKEALVFGTAEANTDPLSGRTQTVLDVAVAAGLMHEGDKTLVAHLPQDDVTATLQRVRQIVENAIDSVRVSNESMPVIVVGGAAEMLDPTVKMQGVSKIIRPEHFQVANAIGAAVSQVPGSRDSDVIGQTGVADGLKNPSNIDNNINPWVEPPGLDILKADVIKQTRTVNGRSLSPSESDTSAGDTWARLTPSRPLVDPQTGEWHMNAWDVECFAVGTGILGAGGGGHPNIGRLRAHEALNEGRKIRIVSPEKLLSRSDPDKDVVVCILYVGAPVVFYEQIYSGQETTKAIRCLQDLYSIGGYADGQLKNTEGVEIKEKEGVVYIDDYQPAKPTSERGKADAGFTQDMGGRRVIGVICVEVGGVNSLEAFHVSASLDLPVLDGDGMGRAFPKVEMFLPYINGQKPYPCAMVGDKGRRSVILRSETAKQMEDHFRGVSAEMGSCAGLALGAFVLGDIVGSIVPRSFSRVWRIGDSILRARHNKTSPLRALQDVENIKVLMIGNISGITQETSGGFNPGFLHVEGVAYSPTATGAEHSQNRGELLRLVVEFYNENVVAKRIDEKGVSLETLAIAPDIISVLDSETAEPIPNEELCYGQRVVVVVLPAAPPMTTPRALQVVGPVPFGHPDVEYVPVAEYKEPEPLAPL